MTSLLAQRRVLTPNPLSYANGWRCKNIFCPRAQQVPLLRHEFHYYVIIALLRHRQIELIEEREKSISHGTGLSEIV